MPQFLTKKVDIDNTVDAVIPPQINSDNNRASKANPDSGLWIRAAKAIIYAGKSLSDAAKVLYIVIRDYQGDNPYAWVSVETLARDLEKSVRTVQLLLKELEIARAIEVTEQAGRVNHYRTCFLELKAGTHLTEITNTNEVVNYPSKHNPVYSSLNGNNQTIAVAYAEASLTTTAKPRLGQKSQTLSEVTRTKKARPQPVINQDTKAQTSLNNQQTSIPLQNYCQLLFNWEAEPATDPNHVKQPANSSSSFTKEVAPMQKITPPPAQKTAPKLDSKELNKVCEILRGPVNNTFMQERQNSRTTTRRNSAPANLQTTSSAASQSQAQSLRTTSVANTLTLEQSEICNLLGEQGMAMMSAHKIAVMGHTKADVIQWIEFAKNRADNPAAYLASVLRQLGSRPPALLYCKEERDHATKRSYGRYKADNHNDRTRSNKFSVRQSQQRQAQSVAHNVVSTNKDFTNAESRSNSPQFSLQKSPEQPPTSAELTEIWKQARQDLSYVFKLSRLESMLAGTWLELDEVVNNPCRNQNIDEVMHLEEECLYLKLCFRDTWQQQQILSSDLAIIRQAIRRQLKVRCEIRKVA